LPIIKISKCSNCGIAHEWDFDAPTLKELRDIKKRTGLNGSEFIEASDSGDPEAVAALLFVLHKRSKITIPFEDVDLDFSTLSIESTQEEIEAAKNAEAESGGKAGPSPANGQSDAGD
jgi:hypothetical protein